MREPLHTRPPEHPRREELARQSRRPEINFQQREAKRWLEDKEHAWAPVAYAVFAIALVLIFATAYTSYAFSKYRGELLPGVHVDELAVGGMTPGQATIVIGRQLQAVHRVPFHFVYSGSQSALHDPKPADIGLKWLISETVAEAMGVGRAGPFWRQLVDRLPFHPVHVVPALYQIDWGLVRTYLRQVIAPALETLGKNASLSATNGRIVLHHSVVGRRLDIPQAVADIQAALTSLSTQNVSLRVLAIQPAITDSAAQAVRARVERFLAGPPTLVVGKRSIPTSRFTFVPMLSFNESTSGHAPTIRLLIAQQALHAYVSSLARQIDRPPQNARLDFAAGQIRVITPRRTGRTLDQNQAYQALAGALTALRPKAHIQLQVAITQPSMDLTNPASLGISTLLAEGETSFSGAGATRLNDVIAIAKVLDNDVLPPNQDVSFNTLAGIDWPSRVYDDREAQSNGLEVPAAGGAMQQVATTFLRALYSSGLTLLERHAHVYRLPWYEPPFGYDAVVAPGRNWDLRFHNNTHHYLLIQTRVEPVKQAIFIYVYGAKLGWHVSVDPTGKITRSTPHGPQIVRQDPSLAPGDVRQIAWPHNGAQTVLHRTITRPSGQVIQDEIDTTYSPEQAIIEVGGGGAPGPTNLGRKKGRGATPGATPTATFSH